MSTKAKENKKPTNLMLRPSVKKKGEKLAGIKGQTLSQFVEELITDFKNPLKSQ